MRSGPTASAITGPATIDAMFTLGGQRRAQALVLKSDGSNIAIGEAAELTMIIRWCTRMKVLNVMT